MTTRVCQYDTGCVLPTHNHPYRRPGVCSLCGTAVVQPKEPPRGEGWLNGHLYGRPLKGRGGADSVLDVRCPRHKDPSDYGFSDTDVGSWREVWRGDLLHVVQHRQPSTGVRFVLLCLENQCQAVLAQLVKLRVFLATQGREA